jgi:hypothetical protein
LVIPRPATASPSIVAVTGGGMNLYISTQKSDPTTNHKMAFQMKLTKRFDLDRVGADARAIKNRLFQIECRDGDV